MSNKKHEDYYKRNLGEIVAGDFRMADVFKKAGIDFCCGGKKSLEQACKEKGIDTEEMVEKLAAAGREPAIQGLNFNEWELDLLVTYILKIHHRFVHQALPELAYYTGKIAEVHGDHHPELYEVVELF